MAQPDPNDFTQRYNTPLSPIEQGLYSQWLEKLPEHQRNTYDYDMQGAWLGGAGQASNGHFPDTYKKPNHPTFSDQSKYSGQDGYVGGHWADAGNDKWVYSASPTNIKFHGPDELQSYFKRVEPDSTLTLQHAPATTAGGQ